MSSALIAQTYSVTDEGTVYTCGGTFNAGSITAGEMYTYTICSDGATSDNHISIYLDSWNVPTGDLLCVYDGPNSSSSLLGCYDGSNWGANHAFTATPANLSGCLTFVFTASGSSASWSGAISCNFSCQPFSAVFDYSVPEVDASGLFTDICPGDEIVFSGSGNYYMNDTLYHQDDANCTFTWYFGDGSEAVGQTVTHTYSGVEGYNISLIIEDQFGCYNINEIENRVRVSTPPTFTGTFLDPDTVCIGDLATLTGIVNPTEGTNAQETVIAGTTYLPDGDGDSYSTSLMMTTFDANQSLTDINDLEGICVNMEHSYLGDLVISITCPNGTQVILEDQGGGSTFLGEPVDIDDPNQPGVGWDYCWSPNPTYDVMSV
ncbi:MAG: hypothetical protein C0594_15745, partial [Marinilabiliales bacterium]